MHGLTCSAFTFLHYFVDIYLLTSTNSEKNRQLQDGYENMIIKIQNIKNKTKQEQTLKRPNGHSCET